MSLIPILIVAVILVADGGLRLWRDPSLSNLDVTLLTGGTMLLALAANAASVAWCHRRLVRDRTPRAAFAAERATRLTRTTIVLIHIVAVLGLGWLDVVRAVTGDVILIDECAAVVPALAAVAATWWIHYPIERRVHDALLIRRLDTGRPVHGIPPRGAYVLLQVRLQLLLLLVPILLIVAFDELFDRGLTAIYGDDLLPWATDLLTLGAALIVFLFSPLLARVLLPVAPLTPGEVRDDLETICRTHGVRVRDILIWHTRGTMINAAVMGLVGPLRYIMMTDALLESMPRAQVLAVMAHEIGHVRRHHMPWLAVSLLAAVALAVAVTVGPLLVAQILRLPVEAVGGDWLELAVTVIQIAAALLLFGWICRRFERQADTFAVQHLSRSDVTPSDWDRDLVSPQAVAAMVGALDTIADLNTVDPRRPSWRHGSIEWRQGYLGSLLRRPVDRLPIDRLIARIKGLAFATVVLAAAAIVVAELTSTTPEPAVPVARAGAGGTLVRSMNVP